MSNVELTHGALPCSVVTCAFDPDDAVSHYEHRRNTAIARMIAALMGGHFAGAYQECGSYGTLLYFVPHRTLVGRALAQRVGIRTPDDLYGGVVPYAFQATKAITHRLVGPRAHRPPGWSARFAEAIHEAVLPGYTAFRLPEAARAGTQLLRDGAVRIKPTHAAGGKGQLVVHSPAELEAALAALDLDQVARCGVVLERHLENVTTYSIGQVHVAGRTTSYYGVQRFTPHNRGVPSSGGSDLVLIRGGFEALLALDLPPHLHLAITQAIVYDRALVHDPHIIVSRRNSDVGQGHDHRGMVRSGVFEQSWRIGGASSAAIAALLVFRADPTIQVVEASSCERYGAGVVPPAGALVHCAGTDPEEGAMTILSVVTAQWCDVRCATRGGALARA